MRKVAVLGATLVLIVIALASGANSAGPANVLKADTLVGVSGPYVGSANPIRGVNGGGIAWDIDEGEGRARGRWAPRGEGRGVGPRDDGREPHRQLPGRRELSDDRGRRGGHEERLDRTRSRPPRPEIRRSRPWWISPIRASHRSCS